MRSALKTILLTTPTVHVGILAAFLCVSGGNTFAEPGKRYKSSIKGDTGWEKCVEEQVSGKSCPLCSVMWKAQQSLPWRCEYSQGGSALANRCAFSLDLGLKPRFSSLG